MQIVLNKPLIKRVLRLKKNRIKRKLKALAPPFLLKGPFDFEFDFNKEDV
jgi:hypothetical protein